jgi:hypothetical protein
MVKFREVCTGIGFYFNSKFENNNSENWDVLLYLNENACCSQKLKKLKWKLNIRMITKLIREKAH